MAASKPKPKRRPAPAKPAHRAKKGGRPTDYRPEHCARVVDLGKLGKSRAQIAAALDVVRDTLTNWEKSHPEFLGAMTRAHELALAWWEDQGQTGIWAGKQFNANAYSLQMRNRFPAEYKAPEASFEVNLDEVRNAIAGKLGRLAAGAAAAQMAAKPQR